MLEKNVENYIAGLEPWKAQIVARLRSIILKAAPQAKESIKWAQPVYETNGPFCYIKAFKNNVNFGFWRGVALKDPERLLQGAGEKMRHIKVTSVNDINEEAFSDFVRQAVQLNLNKGDPTKHKEAYPKSKRANAQAYMNKQSKKWRASLTAYASTIHELMTLPH